MSGAVWTSPCSISGPGPCIRTSPASRWQCRPRCGPGHSRRDAEEAAQAYRARAGATYSPDREETERLTAWARSILTTMEAVQRQLAATGQAFALELAKFEQPLPTSAAQPFYSDQRRSL